MNRAADIRRLYDILDELRERLGGFRQLKDCDGRMGWPRRGLYFFFEEGELRSSSGSGPRVVRVGTHAVSGPSSKSTLWNRLSQHRGSRTGTGSHRGSIFRLLIGEALSARDRLLCPSWGIGSSAGAAATRLGCTSDQIREQERGLELATSAVLGRMPFLWVEADDPPGRGSMRDVIERNTVALLSNYGKAPIDPPSPEWLAHYSSREAVRNSGLWNNDYVELDYQAAALDVLARCVATR